MTALKLLNVKLEAWAVWLVPTVNACSSTLTTDDQSSVVPLKREKLDTANDCSPVPETLVLGDCKAPPALSYTNTFQVVAAPV